MGFPFFMNASTNEWFDCSMVKYHIIRNAQSKKKTKFIDGNFIWSKKKTKKIISIEDIFKSIISVISFDIHGTEL